MKGAVMEEPKDRTMDPEVEGRLEVLLMEFRAEAERHGMHGQVMDLCERYMARAYRRGREDCRD
jgi:hypothetical protein